MHLRRNSSVGFTLLEIMIVVGIIGLMSVLAVPYFIRARTTSLRTRYVTDLRAAESGFLQYSFNTMTYPPDAAPGVIPVGMADYLGRIKWTEPPTIGGQWDWEPNVAGFGNAIRVVGSTLSDEDILPADKRLDNGDLTSGPFQRAGDGSIMYLIE